MSELGDDFKEWNKIKKAKKQENQKSSTQILISEGIEFESRNYGNHLIVQGFDCVIDFWPSTGKFMARGGRAGRGVRNLLKACKPCSN